MQEKQISYGRLAIKAISKNALSWNLSYAKDRNYSLNTVHLPATLPDNEDDFKRLQTALERAFMMYPPPFATESYGKDSFKTPSLLAQAHGGDYYGFVKPMLFGFTMHMKWPLFYKGAMAETNNPVSVLRSEIRIPTPGRRYAGIKLLSMFFLMDEIDKSTITTDPAVDAVGYAYDPVLLTLHSGLLRLTGDKKLGTYKKANIFFYHDLRTLLDMAYTYGAVKAWSLKERAKT